MKSRTAGFVLLLALLTYFFGPETRSHAQNVEGQIIASEYGEYQVWGVGTNIFTFTPTSCQVSGGGSNFAAFTRGLSVLIVDPGNPAINELVTAGAVDIHACSVQLAPVHQHIPPFYLTSGTGGLQETINANLSSLGANTIILSAEWYRLGGSAAIIASVSGTSSLRLEDITTTPATWYQWNGSHYVAVSSGGGVGSLNALTGAVNITPANSNVTVAQSGSNIQIGFTGAPGISSINGDNDAAQSIVGAGGITCSTAAGTTTCNYAGAAGSGAVGSGGPYNDGGYTPSTPGTSIQPETNSLTLPLNLSTTQITNALGTQNIAVRIQAGDAHTSFTNGTTAHNDKVVDDRTDVPIATRSLKEWGAQCDLKNIQGTISGNVLTSGGVTTSDVGKILVAVGSISGVPTVYEGKLGTNITGNSWNISTNPGLTISTLQSMDVGTDDTAAITAAINAQNIASEYYASISLSVPVGNCLTHEITVNPQSLYGSSPLQSAITSYPGESIFAVNGGSNQKWSDLALQIDNRIDATQTWQYINTSGTISNPVAGIYQPFGALTGFANNPVAPGWFTDANNGGAIVGVATTNLTTSITVLSPSVPSVGQEIVFPFATGGVFTTTVASVSGSTVVLNNASPDNVTQDEFFAGTSAQNITGLATTQCTLPCVIPASRTFPMTVTVANSLAPVPGYESNVAGFGVVKIDDEEFSYDSITRSVSGTNSIVLTAGQQNGTAAAQHNSGAVVVPLNPFKYDEYPWPVTPTLNSGTTTPNPAEYYPAFNVGQFGYGTPLLNGASGEVIGPYQGAFTDILIRPWPLANTVSFPAATSAALYFVGWPYSSHFNNLNLFGTSCVVEAEPGLNTGDLEAETGDGTTMDNVSCHASTTGVVAAIMAGAHDGFSNWNTYGGGSGSANSGGGFNVIGGHNDQTGSGGAIVAGILNNIYDEPGGSAYGNAAGIELDCDTCQINDFEYSGGGDILIGGSAQNFSSGQLGSGLAYPAINYGAANSFSNIIGTSVPQSGVYGGARFLNYATGTRGCMQTSGTGPCIQTGLGSSGRSYAGQTADTFATGNITAPYADPILGFAAPENMTGFGAGVFYDPTAPITNHYAACSLTGPLSNCGGNAGQEIGPGQAIATPVSGSSYYTPYLSVKATVAATFFFSLYSSCGGTFYTQTISATTSWQILQLPTVSFSSSLNGCELEDLLESQSVSTQIDLAFLHFQPVAQQLTAQTINLNGPSVYSGSGAPSECGTTYSNGSLYLNTSGTAGSMFYVCIGTTWTDIK